MVPCRIGLQPCPRQGHVLPLNYGTSELIFMISKIFKCAFFLLFMARGNGRLLIFILYALLGLYLLNVGLQFVNLPEFLLKANRWIVIIGGGLLSFESLKFLGAKRVAVR